MKHRNELKLHFTTDVRTLEHCRLDLDSGVTAEVFGDPENGSYEWRLVHANGLVEQHSDCGYGIPAMAMRDALVVFYGTPQFGGDIVDLRCEAEHAHPYQAQVREHTIAGPADWVEAADLELSALRRDASRYRVLREKWLRIESSTIVRRSAGLDLWCDKLLSTKIDSTPNN